MIQALLKTEEDLQAVAQELVSHLKGIRVLLLTGDLGAGKTTFVRYLAAQLGSESWVNSPTYTLVHHYPYPAGEIIHMDLYRLDEASIIESIDLAYYLSLEKTLLVIEWADRLAWDLYPPEQLILHFELLADGSRRISGLKSP